MMRVQEIFCFIKMEFIRQLQNRIKSLGSIGNLLIQIAIGEETGETEIIIRLVQKNYLEEESEVIEMNEELVKFGGYALPFLMTAILAVAYQFYAFTDKWKNLLALLLGIGLSLLFLAYKGLSLGIVNIVDYTIYGFLQGAAAVGLWKTLNIQVRGGRQ